MGANDERRVQQDKVVVVYYSRTGNTKAVASTIADNLDLATLQSIQPRTERSYWNWLLRSFIPESSVAIEPIETDLRDAEAVFLGTPKWTLSCPPITEFIRHAELNDVPTGLFVTYGGFDEHRYAQSLADQLKNRGADVQATLLVKRDAIGGDDYYDRVNTFCRQVLSD